MIHDGYCYLTLTYDKTKSTVVTKHIHTIKKKSTISQRKKDNSFTSHHISTLICNKTHIQERLCKKSLQLKNYSLLNIFSWMFLMEARLTS